MDRRIYCNRNCGRIYRANRLEVPGTGSSAMDFALLVDYLFHRHRLRDQVVVDSACVAAWPTNASEDLIKSMLEADAQNQRMSALKWGLVLTLLGLAFGLISALHLDSDNPGTWGLLIGAAGVGMLAYHGIVNRLR
jgi:hypothetical protein